MKFDMGIIAVILILFCIQIAIGFLIGGALQQLAKDYPLAKINLSARIINKSNNKLVLKHESFDQNGSRDPALSRAAQLDKVDSGGRLSSIPVDHS